MFCSFTVEPKSNDGCSATPDDASSTNAGKAKSNWEQVLQSATSDWAKQRSRVSTPRNVGGARKNKWTPAEDSQLLTTVQEWGSNDWSKVAQFIPGRTGKQCRERWLARLSPDVLQEDWSADEDLTLLSKQNEFGNRWSKIREFLPGRSTVSLKNRWNWLCRRDVPNHSEEFQVIAMSHVGTLPRKEVPDQPTKPDPAEDIIAPMLNLTFWQEADVVGMWDFI
jgi:hypothetical protein